jgi:hypothetical protein
VIGLVLSACASQSLSNYTAKTPDEALLIGVLKRIPAGVRAKSPDVILQAYADDVYVGNFHKYLGVAGPGAPTTIRGKDQVREVYKMVLSGAQEISLDVRDFRLQMMGDRAVAEGMVEMTLKLEARRGEAREDYIRNDVIWRMRRTPAGWKIQEEIFQ